MNNNDLHASIVFFLEIMQWKEMHQLQHKTWRGIIFKGIFLSNLSRPIHANDCSPLGVDAPIPAWALPIFPAEGHGFSKEKHRNAFLKAFFPQLRRQQLGAQGFHILSYLSIYLQYMYLSLHSDLFWGEFLIGSNLTRVAHQLLADLTRNATIDAENME